MANNLHRWCNGVSLTSSTIDNKSTSGYQPNDYLESGVLNTILKECSLVSQMIGEYLKDNNIDCNTTTTTLLSNFENKLKTLTVSGLNSSIDGVVYQNNSNTKILNDPNKDSILTYSTSNDSLEWIEQNNLKLSTNLSNSYKNVDANSIQITSTGNYLVKASIKLMKDDILLTTNQIDELLCITNLNQPIRGKVVFLKIVSGSGSGQDVNVACQLKYNGDGFIHLYTQKITNTTTLNDLINITDYTTYIDYISLQYKQLI